MSVVPAKSKNSDPAKALPDFGLLSRAKVKIVMKVRASATTLFITVEF